MARLLVLTDRATRDSDWKGAMAWKIILALAESQHEVLVLTTLPVEQIEATHSRLTVARPVDSWSVVGMPRLARAVIRFRPEVIHTFAPHENGRWPATSVWPYLSSVAQVLPQTRCYSTLFDEADAAAGGACAPWHRSAHRTTVFSERHRILAERSLGRKIEVLPIERIEISIPAINEDTATLIPAAVSEWENPVRGLQLLTVFLARHPEVHARILGGWGSWPVRRRKEGWQILGTSGARVQMCSDLGFQDFLHRLPTAHALWLDPLRRDSWKFLLANELGQRHGKDVFLSSPSLLELGAGSTANSLSRLYAR